MESKEYSAFMLVGCMMLGAAMLVLAKCGIIH